MHSFIRTYFRARRIVALLFMFLLTGCTKYMHEEYRDLENQVWVYSDAQTFDVSIPEGNTSCDLLANIRYSLSYPFYNLYLKYELRNEDGKILRTSILESNLMDAKTGKPLGNGGGGVYDREIFIEKLSIDNPGTYHVTLSQYMRQDTLVGVSAVGLFVNHSE